MVFPVEVPGAPRSGEAETIDDEFAIQVKAVCPEAGDIEIEGPSSVGWTGDFFDKIDGAAAACAGVWQNGSRGPGVASGNTDGSGLIERKYRPIVKTICHAEGHPGGIKIGVAEGWIDSKAFIVEGVEDLPTRGGFFDKSGGGGGEVAGDGSGERGAIAAKNFVEVGGAFF